MRRRGMLRRRALLALGARGRSASAAAPALRAGAAAARSVASFSILGDFVGKVGGDRVEVDHAGRSGRRRARLSAEPGRRAPRGRSRRRVRQRPRVRGLDRPPRPGRRGPRPPWSRPPAGVTPLKADGGARPRPRRPRPARLAGRRQRQGLCDEYSRCASSRLDPAGADVFSSERRRLSGQARCAGAGGARRRSKKSRRTRRKVITSHDAFGYFARAYGLAVHRPPGRLDGRRSLGPGRGPHHPADQGARRSRPCSSKTSPIRA